MMMSSNNRQNVLSVILLLTAGAAVVVALYLYLPEFSNEKIRLFINDFGPAAPAVFVIICILKPLLFFVPSLGLTVIAGTLFGPFYGTLYVAMGGAGSTIVAFYMARKLGRKSIERFIKDYKKLIKIDERMEREGFKTVIILRALNIPWDMVSYSAGFSRIRFGDFYLGSLVLLLPISFIYTYFGSVIWRPFTPEFLISLTTIVLFASAPFVIGRLKKGGYVGKQFSKQ
ncbi:MAG: TVP38/TMEM64 family protein [Thermodesulfobacteriota bacterium]